MKPSLVFMMRLSGSVKFFCAFGSGSSEGGAAGLPGFLRPSASRCFSASARALRSASAAAPPSAPRSALAPRVLLSPAPGRPLPAPLAAPEGGVLAGVRLRRGVHPARDLGLQFLRPLAHPLVAHRLVLGGVGLDLRPIERDMAKLDQPGPLAQAQHLAEKRRQRVQMTLAELRDRAEIRGVETDDAHEVDAFPPALGDRPD